MPELPDVEIFKQYLDATSLHRTIKEVQITDDRILHGISPQKIRSKLKGHKMQGTLRHGKYLFIQTDGGLWLYLHFGMTGNVKYFKNKDHAPDYSRMLIRYTNGYHLVYVSQRLLGKVGMVKDTHQFIKKKNLGPDAQKISWNLFQEIFKNKKGSIKSALMDQKVLAGIGNLYADEILYQARIHPKTAVNKLDERHFIKIFNEMKTVITTAIQKRADPEQFPGSYLLPHRDKDGHCPRSHSKLKHIKINGRTSYFCPRCQSL
jgi:formamidopyrimidine-DNA glycosylase